MNPEEKLKGGQKVVLTCNVLVSGVAKDTVTWYKDGEKITEDISKDRCVNIILDAIYSVTFLLC